MIDTDCPIDFGIRTDASLRASKASSIISASRIAGNGTSSLEPANVNNSWVGIISGWNVVIAIYSEGSSRDTNKKKYLIQRIQVAAI
ncbi:hypothetical protein D3C74_453550 [compost metagenome]